MTIQSWGEDRFIQYIADKFSSIPGISGIGDDCAVIPTQNGEAWLVTTDALVEGVHFIKEQIPPQSLGYKTIAVNVSDIVSMGGQPKYAFLVIALPKSTPIEWLKQFVEGIHQACKEFNIFLLGGDTCGSKRDLFLNVTLTGRAKEENIKFRHSAKAGDLLCTTGFLGNSAGGLYALEQPLSLSPAVEFLIHSHFHPQPSIEEGIWLGSQKSVHAMMDISDGLDCDLRRMLNASHCGAIVELTQLPISPALKQVCQENLWNATELALTGGEDYCLLLTVASDDFERIKAEFQHTFSRPLHTIGYILSILISLSIKLKGKTPT